MKFFGIPFFVLFLAVPAMAQQDHFWDIVSKETADSLFSEFHLTGNDTLKMKMARSMGWYLGEVNHDSALYFNEIQRSLAKRLNLMLWEADALDQEGWNSAQLKNYPLAQRSFSEALRLLDDPECIKNIWRVTFFSKDGIPANARLCVLSSIQNDLSRMYAGIGSRQKELFHLFRASEILEASKDTTQLSVVTLNLAESYLNANQLDSAWLFAGKSLNFMDKSKFYWYKGYALTICGNIYLKRGEYKLSKQYFDSAIVANNLLLDTYNQINQRSVPYSLVSMGELLRLTGNIDSAILYKKAALQYYDVLGDTESSIGTLSSLYTLFKSIGKTDSAYHYLQLAKMRSDNFYGEEKTKMNQFQNLVLDEQLTSQEAENRRIKYVQKLKINAFVVGGLILIVITLFLFRTNLQRKKTNRLLSLEKEKVENTLLKLKSTQAQLIQSEKMASLGELSAGIAHEIQNPLNFVNNFSEINQELLEELKGQRSKVSGERNEELESELLDDITANESKINHHGKRADSIVKGMMQHAQKSSGEKILTDINSLADEYLRLSYHAFQAGLKSRDNNIHATVKTDFDNTIGKIYTMPQDIGRVLLNLYNNAFYAVHEKFLNQSTAAMHEKSRQQVSGYEPTIKVTTRKDGNFIEIKIADNGMGIPQDIIDKIFQPFFTTKPTGEGTGLGLSISYDIVKANQGILKVNSAVGQGTEFIVQLPV